MFIAASPVLGVEAERCAFDPACLCITWYSAASARVEVRCPDYGGWTNQTAGPVSNPPTIEDPAGSFRGNGLFEGGFFHAPSVSLAQQRKLSSAIYVARDRLESLRCAGLFQNSPLTENALWLLSKIQWRNGELDPAGFCTEPDVKAYYRHPSVHEPIVYLCDAFTGQTLSEAATTVIHELLHVAGQREDDTWQAGPGDYPISRGITFVIEEACNLY